MDLGFLRTTAVMPVVDSAEMAKAESEAGGGSTIEEELDLTMQVQEHSNWCWTAQGTSIGLFFGTGSWTQCDTATNCLSGVHCCSHPGPCNVYGFVHKSLTYTKSFNARGTAPLPGANVISQIQLGNPVVMRCAWTLGGAHFIAISGYSHPASDPSQITITIKDSIYGERTMLLSDFPFHYHGGGTWTHTYLTKKN